MISTRQKLTLDSARIYKSRCRGELDESWTDWNGKMTVTVERVRAKARRSRC